MKTIKIYEPINAAKMLILNVSEGAKVKKADYKLVFDGTTEDDVKLNTVFEAFQKHDDQELPEGYEGKSVSIGHLIGMDGKLYRVNDKNFVTVYFEEENNMNNNTKKNNAVVNNNVKEESTMSKIFNVNNAKVAAATPFTLAGAGAAFVAEVCRASAEKIAGDQVSRAPGYGYLAAHTTGSISSKKMAAMAEALKAEAKKEASEEKHSKYATWDKWHWVASEAAKEKGWGIPSLYKAANRLIDCSRKGADFVPSYKDGDDKPHTLAVWVYRGLYDHITNVLKKDVDDDRLKTAFEQAVKLSKASIDKLPKVEDIIAFAQAEAKLVNNAKVEQPVEVVAEERITVEEGREILAEVEAEEEEARDGRAPKTTAKAKFNINELVHKIGMPRLKADNAYQVAEKAKAAFEAKKLTDDEFQFVVNACIAKDGGDPEEFYALMGEN